MLAQNWVETNPYLTSTEKKRVEDSVQQANFFLFLPYMSVRFYEQLEIAVKARTRGISRLNEVDKLHALKTVLDNIHVSNLDVLYLPIRCS